MFSAWCRRCRWWRQRRRRGYVLRSTVPCVTWLVAAEVDGGIERGSDQRLRGLCELQVLVVAEVDGGSERGCDRGLRGLRGPNVSMVTSPDKKSVKTFCGSGPRGLWRQMFSPFFCRGNRRLKFCAARGLGASECKIFSGHVSRQKIGEYIVRQWVSRALAANVLTVFLSGESTTQVLRCKRPRGLCGQKVQWSLLSTKIRCVV